MALEKCDKKILLVRVPEAELDNGINDFRNSAVTGLTIPLGVTYLASVIREHNNYDVKILDLYAEYYEDCVASFGKVCSSVMDKLAKRMMEEIENYRPDVIGFSAIFLFQHELVKELVKKVALKYPHIKIFLGGYSTLIPDIVMRDIPEVDVVFIGESENSIIDVIEENKNDNASYSKISGIAYRENGKIIINNKLNLVSDINTIPFPAYDLLPIEKYNKILHGNHFPMLTSRSCPFSCGFCSSYLYGGRGHRVRSIDNLIEEIKLLHDRYNLDFIYIRDENFNVNVNHAKNFLKSLLEHKLAVPWTDSNGFHANSVDFEFLDLCKKTGCSQIIFAVESGSPRVLKEIMNKNVDLDHVRKISAYCNEIDLDFACYFVIGSPGETKDEIKQTIDLANELNINHCTFSIATPFPGTKYANIASKKGYLKNTSDSNSMLHMKYMEATIETEEFTAKWLKDTQYDANIHVNFLNNKLLRGETRDLNKAKIKYGSTFKQYNFQVIARLIEGFATYKLGETIDGDKIYTHVNELLQKKDIREVYAKYFDWDTPATNDFRNWKNNNKNIQSLN